MLNQSRHAAVLAVLMAVGVPLSGHDQQKPLTSDQLREEEAYTIGVQAYIYGFPVVEMYRARYRAVYDSTNKNRTPLNQFGHARKLIDHTYAGVVSPNNDTLYSSAWLDLAAEPIIFEVPAIDKRYYSFQFMDFFTNNFTTIGRRTSGGKAGVYAVVGPLWKGELPKGVQRIAAPTRSVWLLGRTLVDGKDDVAIVHALQDQYRLTPLSTWTKAPGGKKPRKVGVQLIPDRSQPLKFFEILNAGLHENPPPIHDAVLMSLFERIGVGPGQKFRIEELNPATKKGLERAVAVAQQMIADRSRRGGKKINGWNLPPREIGNYGANFLLRAQVAHWGLAALSPEEAVYFTCYHDDKGQSLDGKHRYTLRFEKGQIPAVEAFWSLTMYRLPELYFVNNPIGRYAIGDRSKGLRYAADGALVIYLQHESPGKNRESNWLPAPAGAFSLNLRAYLPRPEVRNGTWKIPAVGRVE